MFKLLVTVQLTLIFLVQSSFAGSSPRGFSKIDPSGRFLSFPGVTVVSSVGERNQAFWQSLHEKLSSNSLIQQYFSFLPPSSYHMTTINLRTASEFGEFQRWAEFIGKELPWFQSFNRALESHSFEPRVSIDGAMVSSVIMVVLRMLDDRGSSVSQVAKEFGVSGSVPRDFHVTLAYAYKGMSREVRIEVEHTVKQLMTEFLSTYSALAESMTFDAPKLTYFNDMTQFYPWSGELNPFRQESCWWSALRCCSGLFNWR